MEQKDKSTSKPLLNKIKSYDELKELFDLIQDQGFSYLDAYKAHNSKVSHIINKNNTLNIKVDDNFQRELYDLNSYEEIDKKAKEYFSKFSSVDKINELLNSFNLKSDGNGRAPSNWSEPGEIIKWIKFRKKYNLKDEYKPWAHVFYYNLDKNILKIKFPEHGNYDFRALYQLVFNEKCDDILNAYNRSYGRWYNIGKISIKFYQNGNADIKGNLDKFKEYYYKYLKSLKRDIVIKYKGKIEKFLEKD